LTINLVNPAEYNYYAPQVTLLVAGLFSLYVTRYSALAGLGVYGSLSLLGLLLMFCEHAHVGGDWSTLVFLPVLGVAFVGCCIRSVAATLGQSGVVFLGNLLTGVVYDNLSGVFALWLTTSIITVISLQLCQDKNNSTNQIGAIWARWRIARHECNRLERKLENSMDGSP
jgi:hypothetical protein